MDGLILPDIPFEEKEEFDGLCKLYGLDLISLIAPPPSAHRPRPPQKRSRAPPLL
ncbi:tryptophan synthase subunit alpha [bacterium]|nr:tryptophan synthase subunit alpha [bacterium]